MKVSELAEQLGLKIICGGAGLERALRGCYIGDLLSLAMSRVQKDNVWITIQTNINVAAVASLTEAGCVLLCDGFTPDENMLQRAELEEIAVLGSEKTAYELAGALTGLGI